MIQQPKFFSGHFWKVTITKTYPILEVGSLVVLVYPEYFTFMKNKNILLTPGVIYRLQVTPWVKKSNSPYMTPTQTSCTIFEGNPSKLPAKIAVLLTVDHFIPPKWRNFKKKNTFPQVATPMAPSSRFVPLPWPIVWWKIKTPLAPSKPSNFGSEELWWWWWWIPWVQSVKKKSAWKTNQKK